MGDRRPHLRGKGSAGERRYKGRTRSQQIERRATFVIDVWTERPSLGYGDMITEVRRVFECGEVAAEQAIKRAYERLEEAQDDKAMTARITAIYLQNIEDSRRAGDRTNVRKTADSLRAHLGLGAPDRIEVTVDPEEVAVTELEDAELEALLAKLDPARAAKIGN